MNTLAASGVKLIKLIFLDPALGSIISFASRNGTGISEFTTATSCQGCYRGDSRAITANILAKEQTLRSRKTKGRPASPGDTAILCNFKTNLEFR